MLLRPETHPRGKQLSHLGTRPFIQVDYKALLSLVVLLFFSSLFEWGVRRRFQIAAKFLRIFTIVSLLYLVSLAI
jgi:phage-related holin